MNHKLRWWTCNLLVFKKKLEALELFQFACFAWLNCQVLRPYFLKNSCRGLGPSKLLRNKMWGIWRKKTKHTKGPPLWSYHITNVIGIGTGRSEAGPKSYGESFSRFMSKWQAFGTGHPLANFILLRICSLAVGLLALEFLWFRSLCLSFFH